MGKHRKPGKARTRGPGTSNPKHRRDVDDYGDPIEVEDDAAKRIAMYVVPRPRDGEQ